MDEDDEDDDVFCACAREDEDPIGDRAERKDSIRNAFRQVTGRQPYQEELVRLVRGSWMLYMSPVMAGLALQMAAGHGAASPVDYALKIMDDWSKNDVMTPEQAREFQVEYLKENGKCGLYGTGDPVEDYRQREQARERRRQENLQAGSVRYG